MTNPPRPKRRWYQYSLRTLFVLMTLVAIACSWYAYEMQKAAKRRAAIAEIEKAGGGVLYYDASSPGLGGEPPAWYSLLRKLHGDEHLGNAVFVQFGSPVDTQRVTDADLVHLKGLTKLEILSFWDKQITDAGLVHLRGMTHLEELVLIDTKVTAEGVKKLQEALPNCKIDY